MICMQTAIIREIWSCSLNVLYKRISLNLKSVHRTVISEHGKGSFSLNNNQFVNQRPLAGIPSTSLDVTTNNYRNIMETSAARDLVNNLFMENSSPNQNEAEIDGKDSGRNRFKRGIKDDKTDGRRSSKSRQRTSTSNTETFEEISHQHIPSKKSKHHVVKYERNLSSNAYLRSYMTDGEFASNEKHSKSSDRQSFRSSQKRAKKNSNAGRLSQDFDTKVTAGEKCQTEDIHHKSDMEKSWKKRSSYVPPTHCLMLKITDSSIHQKIGDLQTSISSTNPEYLSSFVPLPSLHLPLLTLTVHNTKQLRYVYDKLELSLIDIMYELSSGVSQSVLLNSLSHYQNRIVFMNVEKNDGLSYLKKVRKLFFDALRDLDVDVRQEQFKRGVTVMKLSNTYSDTNKKAVHKIPSHLYDSFSDFGQQTFDEIHFCTMPHHKYNDSPKVLATVDLVNAKMDISDQEFENSSCDKVLEGWSIEEKPVGDSLSLSENFCEVFQPNDLNGYTNESFEDNESLAESGFVELSQANDPSHATDNETMEIEDAMPVSSVSDVESVPPSLVETWEIVDQPADVLKESKELRDQVVRKMEETVNLVEEKEKCFDEIPTETSKKKKKKSILKSNENDESTNEPKKRKGSVSKDRPTHFLAFRIRNQDIHQNVVDIHQHILSFNQDYRPAFIKIPTLHVTLVVMTLTSKEDIDAAIGAMETALALLRDIYNKSESNLVEFDKLGTFGGQVLFTAVKESEQLHLLKDVVDILKNCFNDVGVRMTNDRFTPHATVMKLSKCYSLKKKGIKKIAPEVYEKFKEVHFGSEEFYEVLLCSMTKGSNEDFYDVLASINLRDDISTRFDDVIERPPKTKSKNKQTQDTNTKNVDKSQRKCSSEITDGGFVLVGEVSKENTDSVTANTIENEDLSPHHTSQPISSGYSRTDDVVITMEDNVTEEDNRSVPDDNCCSTPRPDDEDLNPMVDNDTVTIIVVDDDGGDSVNSRLYNWISGNLCSRFVRNLHGVLVQIYGRIMNRQ